MSRLRNRLFTLSSGLSLVLCAAACASWVRSHRVHDVYALSLYLRLEDEGIEWACRAESGKGGVGIELSRLAWARPPIIGASAWRSGHQTNAGATYPTHGEEPMAGFVWYVDGAAGRYSSHQLIALTAPHWSIVSALFIPPLAWGVRRHFIGRRSHAGRCTACGYDLRATPARCPECGSDAPEGTSAR